MQKQFILTLSFFLFLGFSATQAQSKTPGVTKRQINQQKRIAQGVKSGELTKREVIKLEKNAAQLQRQKKKAKADGVVTPKERVKLHRKANSNSRKIYKQKHDPQKRK